MQPSFQFRPRPGWRQFKTSQYVRRQAGQTITLREHLPHAKLNRFRVYAGRRWIGGAETVRDVERLITEYIDSIAEPVF